MSFSEKNFKYTFVLFILIIIGIYLFVTAPDKLADKAIDADVTVSAEEAISILATEQSSIRAIYTKEIVGAGLKAGLNFNELWKDEAVHAGPLPALLLRETSNRMFLKSPELNFFLGSDYPIVKENLFTEAQLAYFEKVKNTQNSVFFYDEKLKRTVGMFPDFASANACVTCHNEHKASPKNDWKLNDIMGATTWAYTGKTMSATTLASLIKNLRNSSYESYASYLDKVQKFDKEQNIKIGNQWPSDGLFLPDLKNFKNKIEKSNSDHTLNKLLTIYENQSKKTDSFKN